MPGVSRLAKAVGDAYPLYGVRKMAAVKEGTDGVGQPAVYVVLFHHC